MISSIRARPAGLRRAMLAAALIALPLAGCVAGDATVTRSDGLAAAARARRAAVAAVPIDRLTAVAKRRYADEVWGRQAHATLRRVGRDRALLGALRSGDLARLRSYVDSQFHRVWYHWHVSRLRIVRGSRILTDVGVPFVVAPSQRTLRDARGRSLATLQVSIQDVVGFVRYMHRNYGVDVLVRGRRASHVRTSLPAARDARLPDSGTATVAGTRYQVRSFTRTALGHEAVRVWILRGG